ncbi:MAG TPA: hypothetical protein VNI02_04675 [Blastocatellia bacterium]|jgi:hypothetical protein|nr:hypothetical protein [Blastocatellia bacterium]
MYHQPVKNIATSVLKQSIKKSTSVIAATLVIFGCVATGLAGGFQLSVETPSATHQLKDAVLFVRTFGCNTPADAKLSATAEGVVNGERRSLPLELTYDSTGVYALKQQWPSEGAWVLAITGEYNSFISTLIVDLGPNGKVHPGTRLDPGHRKGTHALIVQRKATTAEIDSALKTAAGNISQLSPDGFIDKPASQPAAWVVGGVGAFFFLVGFAALTRKARSKSAASDRDGAADEGARG